MPVEFRYATRDEYPAISTFLNEYWAADHIYCRNERLFQWTFHRRGHWPDEQLSVALAEHEGELVGILGGIPFTFNHFGEQAQGIWMANYVIRPDHRRGPTALQLLSKFRQPPFFACVAFGINPATSAIYRVMRGEVLPEVPRHVLVLPGAQERVLHLLSLAQPSWTVERTAAMVRSFLLEVVPEKEIAHTESLPDTWDRIDWPAIARSTVGAARNADYLTWRYLEHPVFEYRVIAVPEGDRTGLLLWRLETIRQATEHGRVDVDRIGRMVEFLPVSRGNARNLFQVFLQKLCAAGACGADFYGYHGQTRAWLEEMGFRPATSHPDGNSVPTRFQPLDGKGGGILSALFLEKRLPPCNTELSCPWYWTKSDSDQDRPN